jgi:hypothetical protein
MIPKLSREGRRSYRAADTGVGRVDLAGNCLRDRCSVLRQDCIDARSIKRLHVRRVMHRNRSSVIQRARRKHTARAFGECRAYCFSKGILRGSGKRSSDERVTREDVRTERLLGYRFGDLLLLRRAAKECSNPACNKSDTCSNGCTYWPTNDPANLSASNRRF